MANPFKDRQDLIAEINNYLKKYHSTIYNDSKRISDFFEMACYNNIIKFYENTGYTIKITNIKNNKFCYKCTTAGNPANYSFFSVSKFFNSIEETFEIRHNINIQSAHQGDIYTTPDISIIKPESIKIDYNFYKTQKEYFYIQNDALNSFCEVKHFNPYPELLFNFIGVVNELMPRMLEKNLDIKQGKHLAPALMTSGKSNAHTDRIIISLQNRYNINIFSDLFNAASTVFSKRACNKLQRI